MLLRKRIAVGAVTLAVTGLGAAGTQAASAATLPPPLPPAAFQYLNTFLATASPAAVTNTIKFFDSINPTATTQALVWLATNDTSAASKIFGYLVADAQGRKIVMGVFISAPALIQNVALTGYWLVSSDGGITA